MAGGVRDQYHHAVDIVPTILDCAGLDPPRPSRYAQTPMHGVSMRYTFTAPGAPSTRHTQLYEMPGAHAIYRDGWKAVAGRRVTTGGSHDSAGDLGAVPRERRPGGDPRRGRAVPGPDRGARRAVGNDGGAVKQLGADRPQPRRRASAAAWARPAAPASGSPSPAERGDGGARRPADGQPADPCAARPGSGVRVSGYGRGGRDRSGPAAACGGTRPGSCCRTLLGGQRRRAAGRAGPGGRGRAGRRGLAWRPGVR